MEKDCYTILIVDDHDIVCAGIKALLKKCQACDIHEIDTVCNYDGILEFLKEKSYNLLILDLHLGDVNTFSSIRKISKAYPEMKILVCSMYPEDPYAIECIREGAVGYLNKRNILTSFQETIDTIIKDKTYIDPEYTQCFNDSALIEIQQKPSLNILSKREFEICHYIVSGLSFKEIALKLDISSKTVSTHHKHILEKFSFSNTAQLIDFVLQHTN